MSSNGEDERPCIVPSPSLLVELHGGHVVRQAVPLQHHPGVDKLEPEFIWAVMPPHHIRVKGKDVLLRTFPSPAGHSMTNCMSLQLLPFKLNSILISHNYDNAKDTYFESAVFLRTRRSSTAKVVFLELRALEGEGRVDSGSL